MRILLIGFGVVGQGLVQILRDREAELRERCSFTPRVTGVATRSRGTLYHPDGLSLDGLLQAIESGSLANYPQATGLQRDRSVEELIRSGHADVLVEASWSDLQTGQPAIDYCRAAFASGMHVVLANKGPAALAHPELAQAARETGLLFRYEATVMAGTPVISMAQEALAGCTIRQARGILNGTTNYILSQMEAGLDYDTALKQADERGYLEADPMADLGGWDAAGKVLILSAVLFGRARKMEELAVQGITEITRDHIEAARAEGERYRLVGEITPEGGQVRPVRLPMSDPLANITGTTNAITLQTDLLGDITLSGPGAGRLETGHALLADLLAIHRKV